MLEIEEPSAAGDRTLLAAAQNPRRMLIAYDPAHVVRSDAIAAGGTGQDLPERRWAFDAYRGASGAPP